MERQMDRKTRGYVRWMTRKDLDDVLEIETASCEFPWSEKEFIRALRQRNCIGMVNQVDQHIAGFMVYELHKTSLDLVNFAVHPAWRRSGLGRGMIQKLIHKLGPRRDRILCGVRETNLHAQLFFRALDFRAVRVLRRHYQDTHEDAYLLVYRQRPPADLAPVNRIARRVG